MNIVIYDENAEDLAILFSSVARYNAAYKKDAFVFRYTKGSSLLYELEKNIHSM